ncbi:pentapeptide repeat-containing protein [Streptomyces sp. NPDC021080]|uniref:pentapeptide repeat-containing protein n=1 Tax=Streptomyces sp. NPDC021080 TaxID=3365110 RepID=UPI0037B946C5
MSLVVSAWLLFNWLIGSPPKASPKPLDITTQLELAKLAFATVAGLGALVALVTAYRKQRIDEVAQILARQVARDTNHDATERRITDLFGQSVEQLGHEQAPVRLGGLYSLERLAQDNPDHRDTVVSVICAYLRMPFLAQRAPGVARQGVTYPLELLDTLDRPGQQELQVRLTAQGILTKHVFRSTHSNSNYWPGIHLDLSGAELIHFSLSECKVRIANFEGARFIGGAGFRKAEFTQIATFIGASFQGMANFKEANFTHSANFDGAIFQGATDFTKSTFGSMVTFSGTSFDNDVNFTEAKFSGSAIFTSAKFTAATHFNQASLRECTFYGSEFSGFAVFDSARFHAEPDFDGASASHPNDDHSWPGRWRTDPTAATGLAPLVSWE